MRLSGIGYKSLIIAGALTLFALPASASGIIYSNYSGNYDEGTRALWNNSVSFTALVNSNSQTFSLFATPSESNYLTLTIGTETCNFSGTQLLTGAPSIINCNFTLQAGQNYSLAIGAPGGKYIGYQVGVPEQQALTITDTTLPPPTPMYKCSDNACVRDDTNGTYTDPSCNNECVAPPTPPLTAALSFVTPTSTALAILTNISDQLGDMGFLGMVVLAAGINLAFWGIEKLLDLMPKDKEK